MTSNGGKVLGAFIDLLLAASQRINGAHWFRIYDHPKDSVDHPSYFDDDGKCRLSPEVKTQRINLNKMSLRELTGLNKEQYLSMLVTLKLLRKKNGVDENGDDVNLIAKSLYNHFQGIHQLVPQFSNAFVNTENNLQCEHS